MPNPLALLDRVDCVVPCLLTAESRLAAIGSLLAVRGFAGWLIITSIRPGGFS